MILLKEGWRYSECSGEEGDFMVAHRECFNVPQPAMFHSKPKKGGSRVIPENVKVELKGDLPSEIIFGLWSTLCGSRGFTGIVWEPLYFNQAYVHIPFDFNNRECQLILVYSIIWNLMVENKHNYTKGKIGFKEVREDEERKEKR